MCYHQAQEHTDLSRSLPLSLSSTVWVRASERMDALQVFTAASYLCLQHLICCILKAKLHFLLSSSLLSLPSLSFFFLYSDFLSLDIILSYLILSSHLFSTFFFSPLHFSFLTFFFFLLSCHSYFLIPSLPFPSPPLVLNIWSRRHSLQQWSLLVWRLFPC